MPFTIPPATRAVGTADPPGDMNNASVSLTVLAAGNVQNSAYAGGADPSGAADSTAAIQAALTAARSAGGGTVTVPPGTYVISAPLRVGSGTALQLAPGTTVTLAAGSNCNAVQSWAVQANRRVLDLVANATTTVTSATAAFTSADAAAPNNKIRIYYADGTYQDTTIASVTNGTTAVLAVAAAKSGTGLFAAIGAGRDTNIRLTGGTWARPSPNNPASAAAHQIRFRHVDVLEVGPVYGTQADGRYLVSLGDVSQFYVHDVVPASTVSDTLHINGPAAGGVIHRVINPAPGDDLVGLTCGELGTYADVMGNITDIEVDNVVVPIAPASSPVVVKILAGQSTTGGLYTIDRITARGVRSAITSDYAVNIADDPSSGAYTTSGIWGKITLEDVSNTNPASAYPPVNVIGATSVADLEANGLYTANPAANLLVVQASGGGHTGSFITRFKTDAPPDRIVVNSGSSIRSWYNTYSVTPRTQYAMAYGDGSSIQATAPDAGPLDMTGAVSLEMWIVPQSPQAAFWTPFSKNGQYWFEGDGGGLLKLAFSVQKTAVAYQAMIPTALQAGRMYYIAGTYIPSTSVNTYVNGQLLASNTTSIPATIDTSTNAVYLLNRQGFSRYFAGQIADARIWNGALTGADITLHNTDPGNLITASAALLARWKCDEGTGTTLGDSSGNGGNATLSAASWNGPYTPFLIQPQLSTGASHTVDDVITTLQKIGLVHQ